MAEQIRLFKSRHPERPVIPLIVDGKPDDLELECFPPTLKFKLDADGKITDEPSEVQAADAREEGDGESLALAKIVAGILGVSADEVFRRSERGFRSVKREGRRQTRIARIKDGIKFGIEGRPCGRRSRFDRAHQRVGLFRLPKAAAARRYRRADREIRCDQQRRDIWTRGWPERCRGHQFDQRRSLRSNLAMRGRWNCWRPVNTKRPSLFCCRWPRKKQGWERTLRQRRPGFRNLAPIAAISNHDKAREYYAEAAALDPDHVEGMFWNGWFQAKAGSLNEAEAAYQRVISIARGERGRLGPLLGSPRCR